MFMLVLVVEMVVPLALVDADVPLVPADAEVPFCTTRNSNERGVVSGVPRYVTSRVWGPAGRVPVLNSRALYCTPVGFAVRADASSKTSKGTGVWPSIE